MLVARQQELLKIEEQRISGVETQATAILTLVVAIAAFGGSSLNSGVLAKNTLVLGVVAFLLLVSAGFAVAARGPRTLRARFWLRIDPRYAELEEAVAERDAELERCSLAIEDLTEYEIGQVVLRSWHARTAVSSWLADAKALWLTYALMSLLLAFIAAGLAALVVVG